MKRLLILLLMLSQFALAQTRLSHRARISVLTLGPWQGELYSAFGHSAFRVYDPINNIDLAYNYGVFDFDQPNFYLNFARGYLYYKLGVYPYKDFEYHYIYFNRYVHEQVLNLDSAQTQQLFDYLQWNAKPENQHYRYDYFYNNCATKMRDVVQTVFKDSVQFSGSHITTDYTIRELTDIYLVHQPWGDLGIDIGLGLPMDKQASPIEYMFLPDYVEKGFNNATILRNGNEVALVKTNRSIYESTSRKIKKGFFPPLHVFTAFLLFVGYITWRDFKKKKLSNWLDYFFFGVIGVVGALLLFLWTATDHNAAARNFNLLWALPTHLIVLVGMARNAAWVKKYFLGIVVSSGLLLITWPVLPQQLHYALVPIVIAIALRSWAQYKLRK